MAATEEITVEKKKPHYAAAVNNLISHPGVRKYFFNTGWIFAEKGLRLFAAVFIGAYVARYLGPSQYGLLNYSISLVSLFTVLATLGLDAMLIRELVRDDGRRDVLLGTAFLLKMAGVSLVFLCLIGVVELSNADRLTRTLIYIIGFGTLFEVFRVIDFFFQAKVWSKYAVWSQTGALLIISILRVWFVYVGAPLEWFAWSYVIDPFILAVGLCYFYRRMNLSVLAWKFDWKLAQYLFKTSWPMIFVALSVSIYMKIDQVMITWMMGSEANGYYSIAVRLSELWNFIPLAICTSLFPAILNAKEISEELYLKRLKWLYALMISLSLCIAIPVTFLSDFIIGTLFGEDYLEAGSILSLYIWSGVFVFLGVASGRWIISENLQMFRMICFFAAGILNVGLNYFLIRKIGLTGAALSTIITHAFADYFSLLLSKRTRGMFIQMTRSFNLIGMARGAIHTFRNRQKNRSIF